MTDEMRAAEDLVRSLAPQGREVPVLEPLAVDESYWFLVAVDKGLIEFSSCNGGCSRSSRAAVSRRDHFETASEVPRHLFDDGDDGWALRRRYLPGIAAYARAVLDLGYDADQASLLRPRHTKRLANVLSRHWVESDAEFRDVDGGVRLQIVASDDRQATRKLASALDARGSLSALPGSLSRVLQSVMIVRPRYLWVVGPNTVERDNHVFGVDLSEKDAEFERIDRVPNPV